MLKYILLTLSFLIVSCQSNNIVKNKSLTVKPMSNHNGSGFGSQFNFNSEYNITAAHIKDETKENIKFIAKHPYCDVALLKNFKKYESKNIFSESKIGERVQLFGHPKGRMKEVSMEGNIVRYEIVSLGEYTKKCNVAVVNTVVKKGMSGGPVFNEKNEIIGVIFAVSKDESFSYFVPYESFKEWLNNNV